MRKLVKTLTVALVLALTIAVGSVSADLGLTGTGVTAEDQVKLIVAYLNEAGVKEDILSKYDWNQKDTADKKLAILQRVAKDVRNALTSQKEALEAKITTLNNFVEVKSVLETPFEEITLFATVKELYVNRNATKDGHGTEGNSFLAAYEKFKAFFPILELNVGALMIKTESLEKKGHTTLFDGTWRPFFAKIKRVNLDLVPKALKDEYNKQKATVIRLAKELENRYTVDKDMDPAFPYSDEATPINPDDVAIDVVSERFDKLIQASVWDPATDLGVYPPVVSSPPVVNPFPTHVKLNLNLARFSVAKPQIETVTVMGIPGHVPKNVPLVSRDSVITPGGNVKTFDNFLVAGDWDTAYYRLLADIPADAANGLPAISSIADYQQIKFKGLTDAEYQRYNFLGAQYQALVVDSGTGALVEFDITDPTDKMKYDFANEYLKEINELRRKHDQGVAARVQDFFFIRNVAPIYSQQPNGRGYNGLYPYEDRAALDKTQFERYAASVNGEAINILNNIKVLGERINKLNGILEALGAYTRPVDEKGLKPTTPTEKDVTPGTSSATVVATSMAALLFAASAAVVVKRKVSAM